MLTLFPQRLSTTMDFEVYNQCPYLWFIQRCANFSKEYYNIDLEFGGEFALALEVTRKAFYKQGLSVEDSITLGLESIRDGFSISFAESAMNEKLKTPEKMMEVFQKYFEEYPLDSEAIVPIELEDGSLSVEQTFDVELPFLHPETGKPLIMSCKPDLIGIDKDGKFVLVDEKTSKQSGMGDYTKTVDMYRTKNQFVQYVFGINHNKEKFGDLKITHMVVRRVVITDGKLFDKTKANYGKIPKKSEVVEQYEFIIDNWYQETWWKETLRLVEEMLVNYQKLLETKEVTFRRAYGNCERYFRPCKLTSHCTSGSFQDLFQLGYVQRVYDKENKLHIPLHELKTKLLGENNA